VTILRSLPGVGRTGLATLLVEATEPLRHRDYQALRVLSGVAPVMRRSGKARLVTRRLACNERPREAVYHWARVEDLSPLIQSTTLEGREESDVPQTHSFVAKAPRKGG
jgi:transposase